MKKKEVERFILSNNPDAILQWLASKATKEEKQIAKQFMRQVINLGAQPCNLMEGGLMCATGSVMGIS